MQVTWKLQTNKQAQTRKTHTGYGPNVELFMCHITIFIFSIVYDNKYIIFLHIQTLVRQFFEQEDLSRTSFQGTEAKLARVYLSTEETYE